MLELMVWEELVEWWPGQLLKAKIEKLKLIAKETVDIKGIGFYTLGAKRKSLSDEEKNSTPEKLTFLRAKDKFKLIL